ncbi:MAG: hypothetical protein HY843_06350 [Bdellovibrio sp.]|nr:hypothetical protein [Bdellovibrio sp.]
MKKDKLYMLTYLGLGALHAYLALEHIPEFFRDTSFTHFWKGLGALAGSYYFFYFALKQHIDNILIPKLKIKLTTSSERQRDKSLLSLSR